MLTLDCRFTGRDVQVKPHGSGIRLTIRLPIDGEDHYGDYKQGWEPHSVFLDRNDAVTLAEALAGYLRLEAPAIESAPQPERIDPAKQAAMASVVDALNALLTAHKGVR